MSASAGPKVQQAGAPGWQALLPYLEPLLNSLEVGVLVADAHGRLVLASEAMASLVGLSPEEICALSPEGFVAHAVSLVDDPPQRVREGRLLAEGAGVVCEEFELQRPQRAVVRWVARRLSLPEPCQVVVVTDITAEVDLTAAYERVALTDPMTGLTNRRGAESVIKRELHRSRRYGSPLSFVLFDVDHFKVVNDTHGHALGDEVLRLVAAAIAERVRDSDHPARWGGEEFLVLLSNTPLESARAYAERIRLAIAALPTPIGRPVTISGGVVQVTAEETLTEAIARADVLLYDAKRAGRNCVR